MAEMKKKKVVPLSWGLGLVALGLAVGGVWLGLKVHYYKNPKSVPDRRLIERCNPKTNDEAHNARMEYASSCADQDFGYFLRYVLVGVPLFLGVLVTATSIHESFES